MIAPPQPRVAHPFRSYRKGWVIERSETVVPLHTAKTSKVEEALMPASPQRWVPHPFRSYRKGWVIERSETVVPLHTAETSKVEVD